MRIGEAIRLLVVLRCIRSENVKVLNGFFLVGWLVGWSGMCFLFVVIECAES